MNNRKAIAPMTRRMSTARSRGGVAMLMVLVCLVVGTIMAGVAMTSQDASPALGENACSAAASSWAAESAANLAVAAMQTQADWTDGDSSLMNNFNLAGGSVTVTVTDLAGNPPDDTDREVILTATGLVQGVKSSVQKRVMINKPADLSGAIDPHLGEFALFAKGKLDVQTGATLAEWKLSPEAGTSIPVKVGTGFASAANLSVATDATLTSTRIYTDSLASTTLDSAGAAAAPSSGKVPLEVPAVPELMPSNVSSLLSLMTALNYNGAAASSTLGTAARYLSITVQNGAQLTLDAGRTPRVACGGLLVRNSNSAIIVRGDVTIGVFGNVTISNLAAIVLADSASSLTLYTTGNITVDNATIGAPGHVALNASRTPKLVDTYLRPNTVQILPVSTASGGAAAPTITLNNSAIICGAIHAPSATVAIQGNSWIIGRLTGSDVAIKAGSGIYYDPLYDNRLAFTNRVGPFYKADGTPVDGLVNALASFNPLTGAQNLKTYIPTTVASLTEPVTLVVDGVGGLLGGSDSPLSQGPAATSRSKLRAEARPLPITAMNLEGKQTVASYDDDYSDR